MQIHRVGQYTDTGERPTNEDRTLSDREHGLFALVDGTGGPGAGDLAAEAAAHRLRTDAAGLRERADAVLAAHPGGAGLALSALFEDAIDRAHAAIRSQRDTLGDHASASAALLCLVGTRAWITHVGNVRVWLFRDALLQPLTVDHTVGALRVEQGRMTAEELVDSPLRLRLVQALGRSPTGDLAPDSAELALTDGDTLVLTSSGVHDAATVGALSRALLHASDPEQAARRMVQAAREAGSDRNASALVLEIRARSSSEATERISAVLQEVWLTRDLPEADRVALAPYLQLEHYPSGTVLCREQDVGDALFILVDGRARVSVGDTFLTTLTGGNAFGELCLVQGERRSATVVAGSEVVAYRLSRAHFHELVARRPALGARLTLAILGHVGERLRDLTARIDAADRIVNGSANLDGNDSNEALKWTLRGILSA